MPDDRDLRIFPDEYLPNVEQAPYHSKWVGANRQEAARWAAFRDALLADLDSQPSLPAMSTRYGRSLVAAGKQHMSISRFLAQIAPSPGQPPPASGQGVVYALGNPNWNPTGTAGWWLGSATSTGWTRSSPFPDVSQRVFWEPSISLMTGLTGDWGPSEAGSGPCLTVGIRIDGSDPQDPGIANPAQSGVLNPYFDLFGQPNVAGDSNPFFGSPVDPRPQQGEESWWGYACQTNPGFIAHGQITPDLSFPGWNSFGLQLHQTIGLLGPVMQEIWTAQPTSGFSLGPQGNKWWTCNGVGPFQHMSPPRLALALTGGLNDVTTDDATHTCRRALGPVFVAGRRYRTLYRVVWDAFQQGLIEWWVNADDDAGYVKWASWTGVSTLWRSGSSPDTGTYPTMLNYRRYDMSLPSNIIYYAGFVKGPKLDDVVIP